MTVSQAGSLLRVADFNPHEREARDVLFHRHSTVLYHFNPHEREARDFFG